MVTTDPIPGLKLIRHTGVYEGDDDPTLPFKLTLNFRRRPRLRCLRDRVLHRRRAPRRPRPYVWSSHVLRYMPMHVRAHSVNS